MNISGTITDLPEYDDYFRQRDAGEHPSVDLGLKKPGRGKPTFFRIVFLNKNGVNTADSVIEGFEVGEVVTAECDEDSLRLVWEVDDIARTSAVIRVNGVALEHGAPRR